MILKRLFCCVLLQLFLSLYLSAQQVNLVEYGLRHFRIMYQKDTVNILVQSKKGEEQVRKPIILMERGSLPKPLLVLEQGKPAYGIMPFRSQILTGQFHLVYISKPFTPLTAERNILKPDMSYVNPATGAAYDQFTRRDHPDYYAARDIAVLKYLKQQPWVDKQKMVVAGHSEGGGIVARVAAASKDVTHVLYSTANPMGRMMSIISSHRADDDSVGSGAKQEFEFWKTVVEKRDENGGAPGFSYKSLYQFSEPPINYLQKVKVPVFVTYGTRDPSAPFHDFLQVEMIGQQKRNFTFQPYIGLEHNYFGFDKDGKVVVDPAGWDRVAEDWLQWLSSH